MVIFEKEWGRINSQVYCDKILPYINDFYYYMEQHPEVRFMRTILMEDNAPIHTSRLTRAHHEQYRMLQMHWPANSPDLNPIENVWRLLKYHIGKCFPKTDVEVQQYIEEEWAKMDLKDFIKYIESMPARCQAVIDVDGGHQKW
jgi:transposase